MSIEIPRSPFAGYWEKIGSKNSSDCVVGLLTNEVRQSDPPVVKWSRKDFTETEARSACTFLERSIQLYREALGDEYIVPTSIMIGAKRDGKNTKGKVYIVQPYIQGWTAQGLPESLRTCPSIRNEWKTLYNRLANLYKVASSTNQNLDADHAFPITMTLGSSRRAVRGQGSAEELPATPNILIDERLRLKLCDFGRFTQWSPLMGEAYEKISAETRLPSCNK